MIAGRLLYWQMAAMLPVAVFICLVHGFVTIAFAGLSAAPWTATWWGTVVAILLFPLANTLFLQMSMAHGAWRAWPLGAATALGIGAGFWFVWHVHHKARTPGPWTPEWPALVAAAALAAGWCLATCVVRRRSATRMRRGSRADG